MKDKFKTVRTFYCNRCNNERMELVVSGGNGILFKGDGWDRKVRS